MPQLPTIPIIFGETHQSLGSSNTNSVCLGVKLEVWMLNA